MCECLKNHQMGYHCPCKCHEVIDRTIIERRKEATNLPFKNKEALNYPVGEKI